MKWATKQKGFTIVELLIVVVVIAILAAITIVAYNGVSQKAKASAAQNAAQQSAKKLATYAIDNSETYPATLTSLGFVNTPNISYQYSLNTSTTPQGYCVTATASGVSYYLGNNYVYTGSSSGTINQMSPIVGSCPGHTSSGAASINNLVQNPGIEVNFSSYGAPGGSSLGRDTTRFYQGAASIRTTMPAAASGTTGLILQYFNLGDPGLLQPNSTYTVSMYVYTPSGVPDPLLTIQGTGRASKADPAANTTSLKNQWVRLYNSFVTTSSGAINLYILNVTATTAGQQYWIDNVMVSEGVTTPYNYADGNSAGWVWNGTSGLSTSTGPAL